MASTRWLWRTLKRWRRWWPTASSRRTRSGAHSPSINKISLNSSTDSSAATSHLKNEPNNSMETIFCTQWYFYFYPGLLTQWQDRQLHHALWIRGLPCSPKGGEAWEAGAVPLAGKGRERAGKVCGHDSISSRQGALCQFRRRTPSLRSSQSSQTYPFHPISPTLQKLRIPLDRWPCV